MDGPVTGVAVMGSHQLALRLQNNPANLLVIDSRPFLEFNTCHIVGAVNICCSKIVKRRLQQNKVGVQELLQHGRWEGSSCSLVVVYDQGSWDPNRVDPDSFLGVLLLKLLPAFPMVALLSGGLSEFEGHYPNLCQDQRRTLSLCGPSLTSLSQPCLPTGTQGPTRILPFLYLGSQQDAQDRDMLRDHNITYELNVSASCPKPDFIKETQFMRIPVNDNYSEKLMPHFAKAFNFLDKVRESSGCVLVHCLAGISRSPTVAIAYLMRHLRISSDDAYRYVKAKRPSISPNFNFLGQLLEFEKQLRRDQVLGPCPAVSPERPPASLCPKRVYQPESSLTLSLPRCRSLAAASDLSPTSALARLSFETPPHKRASYEVTRSHSWQGTQGTREAEDDDCTVVLRKRGPSATRRDSSTHDSAYRSLTLEEVVEFNKGLGEPHRGAPLPKSPLSPSESHLLEDFVGHGSTGAECNMPPQSSWASTDLEGSHDSGVTSASSCSSWSRLPPEPPAHCSLRGQCSSSSSSSSSSSLASLKDVDEGRGALSRAQSCPIMVGWLRGLDDVPPPKLSQPRNRYSCGSLEYALCDALSRPSQTQRDETSPRRVLCRSANMIQVS